MLDIHNDNTGVIIAIAIVLGLIVANVIFIVTTPLPGIIGTLILDGIGLFLLFGYWNSH